MLYQVKDWDDAYANGPHIPNADDYRARWQDASAAFRAANPPEALGKGHLFRPKGQARGLVVIIHGGYWMKFSPGDFFSHLAAGAVAQGWAVAMPAYPLAPGATIAQMTRETAAAVTGAAGRVGGPIAITGHSAGGHLAARMICADATLPDAVAARISACLPISALADLRPLMMTRMNEVLSLDEAEAMRESPALLRPRPGIPVTAWVGGMERPEFIRQSRLLADIWAGLGARTQLVIDPGRHHFDVIEGLCDADSPLLRHLLA